ncbi:MAG: nitrate/nitrite transporter NrtS [bacterium]
MKSLLRTVCSARIAHNALRIALVVGTVLNLVNQSGAILVGAGISWFHLILNYFVPYCVASYSAAKNEITRREDAD